ncbi:hypothetical protein BU16DRAFT_342844 [Lophium mytilinum]|uniref:Uncharacterized protein n=1 Tax=Lophium mytilinum TaxID=390894 RepID=A0A6A6QX79_9PEZI|nr:hypothetical protein BU16DRAFT_342844 [Lophium mytilinum]
MRSAAPAPGTPGALAVLCPILPGIPRSAPIILCRVQRHYTMEHSAALTTAAGLDVINAIEHRDIDVPRRRVPPMKPPIHACRPASPRMKPADDPTPSFLHASNLNTVSHHGRRQ